MTVFIEDRDKNILLLSKEFQYKRGNTESESQYYDRYISSNHNTIKEFICNHYHDYWNH